MGRRLKRIGFNIIVGMAQNIGIVKNEISKENRKERNREKVFDGVIGVKGNGVLAFRHINALRIVVAGHMKRPDMKHDESDDDEGEKIMEAVEAVESRVADGESAPKPFAKGARQSEGRRQKDS